MNAAACRSSFAFLSGPITFIRSLVATDRLPFTAVYVGSLGMTLYAALIVRRSRWPAEAKAAVSS